MPSAPTLDLERVAWAQRFEYVAGVDEAGRGCLAGPVVAAAVILPQELEIAGVRDSKTLSAAARESAAERIRQAALSIGIGVCTPAEIDRMNILQAALEAMRRAVNRLSPSPHLVLIDGNRTFEDARRILQPVVRGDRLSLTIAAASILAKTTRDALMRDLHDHHPLYGWDRNAGYPTPEHYRALALHGCTPHHRRTFRLGVLPTAEAGRTSP